MVKTDKLMIETSPMSSIHKTSEKELRLTHEQGLNSHSTPLNISYYWFVSLKNKTQDLKGENMYTGVEQR